MVIKVGINGFGRLGRVIARICLQNCDLELSAINDPAISVEYISYLIKYDSTHGKFKGDVKNIDEAVYINDSPIRVFHEKEPDNIPWNTANVQYVIEASGIFTSREKASGHLKSDGVKRVLLTSPSVDVPMIILGVNDNQLSVDHKVMSCTSSTLYCLAPIIKILEDNFGVAEGFITSIHAMTPSLKPLDGLCLRGKHWRDHRSIHQNIIPASTGACKALSKIIPQVKDKLTGLAFRIPIVNVSVLDLTVRLNTQATLSDIVKSVKNATEGKFKNIVRISKEQTVSSDFIGESHSCIFDQDSSIQLKPNFVKIICWYENEYSYACRVADSIFFSDNQFTTVTSKLSYGKPMFSLKQDVIQQTDCYKKEMSVSCCNCNASSVVFKSVLKNQEQEPSKLVTKKATSNNTSDSSFISCVSMTCQHPVPNIEIPEPITISNKGVLIKSTSITEDVVKSNNFRASFNNELLKKPDQLKIKDKFLISDTNRNTLKSEQKVEICGDYVKPTRPEDRPKPNELGKDESVCGCWGKDKPFVQTATRIIQKPKIPRSILITKCKRQKRDNTLKQTAAQLEIYNQRCLPENENENTPHIITSLVERLAKNYRVQYLSKCDKKTHRLGHKISLYKGLHESNGSPLASIDSADEIEIVSPQNTTKLNLNFRDIYLKLSDEELKKRNTIPIANLLITKQSSDENIISLKDSTRECNIAGKLQMEDPDMGAEIKSIVLSDSPSMCNSYHTNRNAMKLDIYDKLDSASESDSNNSFEIRKRKSQVINITDLTNSFEDLERLDKICRIIEISDELSDELFSSINNSKNNRVKKKKWSFKDLCDKIRLDEFCERVFGIN